MRLENVSKWNTSINAETFSTTKIDTKVGKPVWKDVVHALKLYSIVFIIYCATWNICGTGANANANTHGHGHIHTLSFQLWLWCAMTNEYREMAHCFVHNHKYRNQLSWFTCTPTCSFLIEHKLGGVVVYDMYTDTHTHVSCAPESHHTNLTCLLHKLPYIRHRDWCSEVDRMETDIGKWLTDVTVWLREKMRNGRRQDRNLYLK